MRSTEMVLFAPFLKTSKFLPAYISIYIISLYYSYLILTPPSLSALGIVTSRCKPKLPDVTRGIKN